MIWCILGYVFMGTIGHIFLTGVIGAIAAIKRGYYADLMEIVDYIDHFNKLRMNDQLKRLRAENVFGFLVWLVFAVITWPVEFMRAIFLDIPDAIKMYETQHGIERL